MNDDAVVEIMLNADGRIWVEKIGVGMFAAKAVMTSDEALRMLRLVATEMNTELSDRNPSLAGKLPLWGARVQASIPPVVEAPVFALRKPARVVFTLDDYVQRGIVTVDQANVLRDAVASRKNILVGGGTGSGKTTLMNALLREVAQTEDRVYIVEDNPELQCAAPNKVQVLVQPPTYTWHRAILDAMRFRPDRIIVGEVRDRRGARHAQGLEHGPPGRSRDVPRERHWLNARSLVPAHWRGRARRAATARRPGDQPMCPHPAGPSPPCRTLAERH